MHFFVWWVNWKTLKPNQSPFNQKVLKVSLLLLIGIFIYGVNSPNGIVIHVYGYLGDAKSWFLRSYHIVPFLLYKNLHFFQFFSKMNKILLNKIEFPAFSQKDNVVGF